MTARFLTVLGGLVTLLVPIALLTLYEGVWTRLIIVSSFVSIFSVVVATATRAKSWEIVAATAAYVRFIPSQDRMLKPIGNQICCCTSVVHATLNGASSPKFLAT